MVIGQYVLTVNLVIYEGTIGSRKVIKVNMWTQMSHLPTVPQNMLSLMMILMIRMIQADLIMKGR
jgi:hypothetical protein